MVIKVLKNTSAELAVIVTGYSNELFVSWGNFFFFFSSEKKHVACYH